VDCQLFHSHGFRGSIGVVEKCSILSLSFLRCIIIIIIIIIIIDFVFVLIVRLALSRFASHGDRNHHYHYNGATIVVFGRQEESVV
jgi:hypothetical protein